MERKVEERPSQTWSRWKACKKLHLTRGTEPRKGCRKYLESEPQENFLSFLTEIYTLLVPLGRTVYPDDAKL